MPLSIPLDMNIEFQKQEGSNKEITLLIVHNNEAIVGGFKTLDTNCIFCHVDVDGQNMSKEDIYNEQNTLKIVHQLEQKINELETNSKVIIIGANFNADIALDLVLKGPEFIEGAVLIKPVLNLGLSEAVMNYNDKKVCVILGTQESEAKQAAEEEVNDILEANGFAVTLKRIEEKGAFTSTDVEESKNWIQQTFL